MGGGGGVRYWVGGVRCFVGGWEGEKHISEELHQY